MGSRQRLNTERDESEGQRLDQSRGPMAGRFVFTLSSVQEVEDFFANLESGGNLGGCEAADLESMRAKTSEFIQIARQFLSVPSFIDCIQFRPDGGFFRLRVSHERVSLERGENTERLLPTEKANGGLSRGVFSSEDIYSGDAYFVRRKPEHVEMALKLHRVTNSPGGDKPVFRVVGHDAREGFVGIRLDPDQNRVECLAARKGSGAQVISQRSIQKLDFLLFEYAAEELLAWIKPLVTKVKERANS